MLAISVSLRCFNVTPPHDIVMFIVEKSLMLSVSVSQPPFTVVPPHDDIVMVIVASRELQLLGAHCYCSGRYCSGS